MRTDQSLHELFSAKDIALIDSTKGFAPQDSLSDLLAPSNLTVALDLARRGFAVFPITQKQDGSWTPVYGWQDAATCDADRIGRWWREWESARVGLPSGRQNGITVLDIDRKKGKDGFAALSALGFDPAELSPVMVRTPSGGAHAIFSHCPGLKNSVGKIAPGLDVRNDGGYIVAPGSFKDGKRYEPIGAPLGSVDLPPFPPALVPPPEPERAPVTLVKAASDDLKAWGAAKLQGRADDLAAMGDGDGQNSALNAAAMWAGGAAAHGFLTEDQARSALWTACERCGLRRREFETTFDSGWKAGLRKPISDYPKAIDIDAFDDLDRPGDLSDLLGDGPKPPALLDIGQKIMLSARGEILPTLTNATLYLARADEKRQLGLRLNLMSGQEEWRNGAISDSDLALIRVLIERAGMRNVGSDLTAQAVRLLARKRAYHPVRDWLVGLQHDSKSRLDTWLIDYCGAEDTALVRAIGRAFLIAMVARVMQPGCKHDHVLVLGGKQGIGKSTACAILGGNWFGDNLPALHNKAEDAARYLQGKWLVEISELAPARKADAEDLKSFISRSVDENRAPYARRKDMIPRQCVMVGTTNETTYLRDASGNRRFWPIECGGSIALDDLARDRAQLFAEAVKAFEAGEQWHLSREMEALAQEAQEAAFDIDPWEQPLRDWLNGSDDPFDDIASRPRERVTTSQAMVALGIPTERRGGQHSKRISAILKRCGWEMKRSKNAREWVRSW